MHRTSVVVDKRYQLGDLLGRGGMAQVYRGTDRVLARPVAVKILAEPYDQDREFVRRFRREAVAAARLNHPNIVAVYDTGSDDGTHYLVMELLGETLGERLGRAGPLAPDEAVRIGADIARALAAAHERGVIHRDVKPGNVMFADDGRVKVVDFGIARASGAQDVTRSGLLLGSAWYVSPEQAQGASGDERSDLYGLGCVLYQMLTGRPPFVGDDPLSALYRHVHESPAPPSSIRPVPEDLERIVLRCLDKDPTARFASAAELEAALLGAASDEPVPTLPFPAVENEPTVPVRTIAGEPTEPVAAEPTEPGASAAPEPEAPAPRPGAAAHRRPSARLWQIGAAAVLLLALAVVVGVLVDPLDLPGRAELRRARQAAAADTAAGSTQATGSPTPSALPSTPPELTVEEAHSVLRDAIVAAAAAGQIADEDATAELLDETDDVMRAFDAGDAEELQTELGELVDYTEVVNDEGLVSGQAAAAIGEGLQDFVVALENAGVVEGDAPADGDEQSKGNAYGHDKVEDKHKDDEGED